MKLSQTHNFVPGNPYSAVRPHGAHLAPAKIAPPKSETSNTAESFFKSRNETLQAFPQVVHLLVEPESDLGDDLSQDIGLPLVSLGDDGVDGLETLLRQPEYADGFILEGFPGSQTDAQKLDEMLKSTSSEDHRVLGWELADSQHQEVLDHYLNSGLLWMVPASNRSEDSTQPMLACLAF